MGRPSRSDFLNASILSVGFAASGSVVETAEYLARRESWAGLASRRRRGNERISSI